MAGFNHTLSAILKGQWLIDKQWANAHLPMVIGLIKGNGGFQNAPVQSTLERDGSEAFERPFVVDEKGNQQPLWYESWGGRVWLRNEQIPANSVGVLPVNGPITKYSGNCGAPGSLDHSAYLTKFSKLKNVNSVVQILDTPGGEARAAHDPVRTIQNLGKPVLSFISDTCASLGVWYAAAGKERYLSNELSQVGSVGSYVSFFDFRDLLEKEGIKMHEIYAPQSTDKNKDYNDALDGDYTAIKAHLEKLVDTFISFVASSNSKAAQHQKEWNTGKMFFADEAIKYGLADGVMSLEKVISKAAWLGKRNK